MLHPPLHRFVVPQSDAYFLDFYAGRAFHRTRADCGNVPEHSFECTVLKFCVVTVLCFQLAFVLIANKTWFVINYNTLSDISWSNPSVALYE